MACGTSAFIRGGVMFFAGSTNGSAFRPLSPLVRELVVQWVVSWGSVRHSLLGFSVVLVNKCARSYV